MPLPATGRSNGSAGNTASRQRRLQSRARLRLGNCHSHRTPDRPGSGICQKSSRRCRGCGALCVTPVCYAVLFLYHAYAGERRGRCIRGQHLSLRGSGYAAPKLPTVRWKMICSIIWTPMKAPMTMTNTTSIWTKSNMTLCAAFSFVCAP